MRCSNYKKGLAEIEREKVEMPFLVFDFVFQKKQSMLIPKKPVSMKKVDNDENIQCWEAIKRAKLKDNRRR